MAKAVLISLALLTQSLGLGATESAAEYYFRKDDFKQAQALWLAHYEKHPQNLNAFFRVAELKLLNEGRQASREWMGKFLEARYASLTTEDKKLFQAGLSRLQSTFLTEEGQANYLQAMSKLKRGDFEGALNPLTQAAHLERGNFRVLSDKASAELGKEAYQAYYETLKEAHEANPFDIAAIERLAEAHVYFGNDQENTQLLQSATALPLSPRAKTALAFSWLRLDKPELAFRLVEELPEAGKDLPIVYFVLAKSAHLTGLKGTEVAVPLERFLNRTTRPAPGSATTWDPYQTPRHLEEARKLVAELKTKKR